MLEEEIDTSVPVDFKSYRGNSLLKGVGETITWTPKIVGEYIRCSKDPIYFIENYVKIIHLDQGLVQFKLYDYQKEIVKKAFENRFMIVATARQVGKSTVMTAFMLWFMLFNSEKTIALLANKGETAREILGRIHISYQNLPKWLQQGVLAWNKGKIELENGSRVIAAATSSSAIRGYSINFLFLDEVAHVENWEDFESSVMPVISSSKESRIVMVSTPKGMNHFRKYWINANKDPGEKGYNGYAHVKVNWNQVPGRDENWFNTTLATMGNNMDKFNQEFGVEFLGSSGTLIAGWKLNELVHQEPIFENVGLKKYIEPIIEVKVRDEQSLQRWKIQDPGHKYVLTADTSEGKGLDYSTFHVTDITSMPYQQCCVFRSNTTTPIEFAEIMFNTAKSYNNAQILIEYENLGPLVAQALHNDFGYEGVLGTESAGRQGKRITNGFGKMVDQGVKMTQLVKATGCSLLKLLIEQNQYIIHDFETIEELSTFSRKNNTYRAEEGCHDDLAMALVVFAWLSDQGYFKDLTDINTLATLRDNTIDQIKEELMPFGFFNDDEDLPAWDEPRPNPGSSWHTMTDPFDREDDIGKERWQDNRTPYLNF